MSRFPSVRLSADVIFRELDGEAVLLDFASGRYYGLNAVGTRVWTLLAAGQTVDSAIGVVVTEFDALEDQVARDVEVLVAELLSRGLLIADPASGSGP